MLRVFVSRKTDEVKAANIIADALRDHDATLNHIAEADRKAKDRVDIPLREYEDLKAENTRLHNRCLKMETLLDRIGIKPHIIDRIDTDSVRVRSQKDLRYFTTRVGIEFNVDDVHMKDI